MSVPAPNRNYSTESVLIAVFSMTALLVHLLTNGRYGYFRDELYYIACGRHLDLGYVDQPPLSILLLRSSQMLLGDSLFAIRLLPALAGAGIVALTGLIAREVGGRGWAIALGCAGSLCALFNLAVGNFFSMNAFEPLFWMGSVYLLVRIINGGSPTLWLWFGVLLGLGLENKHSTAFFAVGIFLALLLTPERRHFAKKWIWFGALIAFAITLPNILWEAQHHWPTYELLNNIAHSNKNVALSPAEFIKQQAVFMNPGTLPIWIGGLLWLFASRDGRRYRVLGITYLLTLAEFIVLHGKSYYLGPAYPMLFAAGGVAVERVFAARLQWFKPVLLGAILVTGALITPLAVPILPPDLSPTCEPFTCSRHAPRHRILPCSRSILPISLVGNKWSARSPRSIIIYGPRMRNAPPFFARIMAKPELSISSGLSLNCRTLSRAIKIISFGDRAIGQ